MFSQILGFVRIGFENLILRKFILFPSFLPGPLPLPQLHRKQQCSHRISNTFYILWIKCVSGIACTCNVHCRLRSLLSTIHLHNFSCLACRRGFHRCCSCANNQVIFEASNETITDNKDNEICWQWIDAFLCVIARTKKTLSWKILKLRNGALMSKASYAWLPFHDKNKHHDGRNIDLMQTNMTIVKTISSSKKTV